MLSLPITVKLAGVTYGKAQTNIKTFGNEHIRWFALVREYNNPHDANAIRVALSGEYFMGYIPKETAAHLEPIAGLPDQPEKIARTSRKECEPPQEIFRELQGHSDRDQPDQRVRGNAIRGRGGQCDH